MSGRDVSQLREDTRLEEIPGFDSLQFVILISELQEKHNVSVPVDKALEMETVGELLNCVEALAGQRG